MEEYKFNWKAELKKSFKEFLKDLLFMSCVLISAVLVILTQTDKQLNLIIDLFNSGDWVVMLLILFGLLGLAVVVEKILKIVFWLVVTPLKWLFRKWKNKKQRHPMSI